MLAVPITQTSYIHIDWAASSGIRCVCMLCVCRLSELVSPPNVVREMDWINRHWPDSLPENSPHSKPQVLLPLLPRTPCVALPVSLLSVCVKVQKYCLMSVKDSYTDFHVDFGGTSVWYHILRVSQYIPPPPPPHTHTHTHTHTQPLFS